MTIQFINPKEFLCIDRTSERTFVSVRLYGDIVRIGSVDVYYDFYAKELRNLETAAIKMIKDAYTKTFNLSAAELDKPKKIIHFSYDGVFPLQISVISHHTGNVIDFVAESYTEQSVTYTSIIDLHTQWKVTLTNV